jgi:hypothetical protein
VKKQMVDRLAMSLAHAAPIYNDDPSLSEVVNYENPLQGRCPSKKSHSDRHLCLPDCIIYPKNEKSHTYILEIPEIEPTPSERSEAFWERDYHWDECPSSACEETSIILMSYDPLSRVLKHDSVFFFFFLLNNETW